MYSKSGIFQRYFIAVDSYFTRKTRPSKVIWSVSADYQTSGRARQEKRSLAQGLLAASSTDLQPKTGGGSSIFDWLALFGPHQLNDPARHVPVLNVEVTRLVPVGTVSAIKDPLDPLILGHIKHDSRLRILAVSHD